MATRKTATKKTPAKPNPFDEFRKSFEHHATIDVYGKWMLGPRFHELNEAAAELAQKLGVEHPDAITAAAAAADVREEIEQSRIDIKVRSLTSREYKQLAVAVASEDDDYDMRYDQLAAQVSEPKLTADQWREAETWMGYHFTRVMATANILIDDEGVVPDFSPSTLAVLNAKNSSTDSESPEPTESPIPSSSDGTTSTAPQP